MKTRASMLRRDRRREKNAPPDTPSKPISDDFALSDVVLPPAKLPTPWLYDSEKLLEDLDRVRECVLRIPLTLDAHGPINVALCAVWELRERLTYLIGLRATMQDDWKTRAADKERPAPEEIPASKAPLRARGHGGRALRRSVA
jgi:hypothetical protein